MAVTNQVQLITYPDSLGGDLKKLNYVLDKYFPDLFSGGIHILPPFPSSGDRGFAPLTYLEIEKDFGDWNDIKKLGEKHAILLDLMVNHISAKSTYFQDFLEKGRESEYADIFITVDKIWPDGIPLQDDIDKIFLRRDTPFSEFEIKRTGEKENIWTTFGNTTPSEQIDIDRNSPVSIKLITDFMNSFSRNGVKIVRLDAVGYVIKKPGTSCFFVEPEIYQYLEWIRGIANSLGIEILPEIHADYETQFRLANEGYWVYDFILPYSILEALLIKSSKKLKEYLTIRPHNQFTMLDCHDGIPIKPDMDGLYSSVDAKKIAQSCIDRGAKMNLILSDAHKDPDGFDVHQICGTYYSMLNCDDTAYLIARAIQFFAPGIPQVYYVGLLAGENDYDAVQRTAENREINRHNYSIEEISEEVNRPVVRSLIELIKLRNTHPAFSGSFEVYQCSDHEMILSWKNQSSFAKLMVNFEQTKGEIIYSDSQSNEKMKITL
jgi:sucrose 6(F)-phosphate phosphorylase